MDYILKLKVENTRKVKKNNFKKNYIDIYY